MLRKIQKTKFYFEGYSELKEKMQLFVTWIE